MRATLLFLSVAGCYPAYAPPVRALHSGMPGRLGGGQLEVGGTVGGVVYPEVLVPHLALGLSDRMSIEVGGNFDFLSSQWAMGWGGARLCTWKGLGIGHKLFFDLELGTGYGAGGSRGSSSRDWSTLRAFGVYGGGGIGYRLMWFAGYVRSRVEATMGAELPLTFWPTVVAGLELRLNKHVSFGVAGGYAGYVTASQRVDGWVYQADLALMFDVLRYDQL